MPKFASKQLSALRVHEARLLALMLRTSRLTFVFAAEGTDKSALLCSGVVPLMQRRRSEGAAPAGDQATEGDPPKRADRRKRAMASPLPRTEIAIYFNQWGDAPVDALKSLVLSSLPKGVSHNASSTSRLAEMVAQLHAELGLALVLVLDDFQEFLGRALDDEGVSRFTEEWVEAVLQPDLAVSFLIAMSESSRPRLDRFKGRIPGLDHNSLRLLPEHPGVEEPALMPAQVPVERLPIQAPPVAKVEQPAGKSAVAAAMRLRTKPASGRAPARSPMRVEDVYSFIESTLEKTALHSSHPPWHEADPAQSPRVPKPWLTPHDAEPLQIYNTSVDEPARPALYEPFSDSRIGTAVSPVASPGQRLISALKRMGGRRKP